MKHVVLVLLVWLACGEARAANESDRLVRVARLWGLVKFHHPYLAHRAIDWDGATIAIVPRIRAARSAEEYERAVRDLLAVLDDPVTRVRRVAAKPPPPADVRLEGDILHIVFGDYAKDYDLWRWNFDGPPAELLRARGVIFDLRGAETIDAWAGLGPVIVDSPVPLPDERHLVHEGFPPDTGMHDDYYAAFATRSGGSVMPRTPSTRRLPIVFLTDGRVGLPRLAAGLQRAGRASVVVQGERSASVASVVTFPLGDDLEAVVRIGEPSYDVTLDATVAAPSAGRDPGLETARRLLAAPRRRTRAPAPKPLPPASSRPGRYCQERVAMTPGLRVFAGIRLWNVIHYFYPYKDLIGDWDAVLPELLPRLENAADPDAYALAALEMTARIADSHVRVEGPSVDKLLPRKQPPFDVQVVDGAVVFRSSYGGPGGVVAGDVVVEVAGEPIAARMARIGKLIAASTPQAHALTTAGLAVSGPGDIVALRVRGAGGALRDVSLARGSVAALPPGTAMRRLAGNVGYVDLRRLALPEVDAMFDELKGTRAIIFDLRGYPEGSVWEVASRLAAPGATPTTGIFHVPLVRRGEAPGARVTTSSRLAATDKPFHAGRTIALIDERAMSLAEGSGMMLVAANGTKLVGSPTAGVIGDMTDVCLPGPLRVTFTGRDIRWPDGRQVQRVGLIPDIEARPTLAGIQAGRDEVLERAVRYVETGR